MFHHGSLAHRMRMIVLAILATALVACGTVGGGSAGSPATIGTDAPSDVRITEFEYEGQAATRTIVPVEIHVEGTSDAAGADIYLIP